MAIADLRGFLAGTVRWLILVISQVTLGVGLFCLGVAVKLGWVPRPWAEPRTDVIVIVVGLLGLLVLRPIWLSRGDEYALRRLVVLGAIAPLHVLVAYTGSLSSPFLPGYAIYVFLGGTVGCLAGALISLFATCASTVGLIGRELVTAWATSAPLAAVVAPALPMLAAATLIALFSGALAESHQIQDELREALVELGTEHPEDELSTAWLQARLSRVAEIISAQWVVMYEVSSGFGLIVDASRIHASGATDLLDGGPRPLERHGAISQYLRTINKDLRELPTKRRSSTQRLLTRPEAALDRCDLPVGAEIREAFSVPIIRRDANGHQQIAGVICCVNKEFPFVARFLGRRMDRWFAKTGKRRRLSLGLRLFSAADMEFVAHAASYLGKHLSERRLIDAVTAMQRASKEFLEILTAPGGVAANLPRAKGIFERAVGADRAVLVRLTASEAQVLAVTSGQGDVGRTVPLRAEPLLERSRRTGRVERGAFGLETPHGEILAECRDQIAVPVKEDKVVGHALYLGSSHRLKANTEIHHEFLADVAAAMSLAIERERSVRQETALSNLYDVPRGVSIEAGKRRFLRKTPAALGDLLQLRNWILWSADRKTKRMVAFLNDASIDTPPNQFVSFDDSWLQPMLRGELVIEPDLPNGKDVNVRNRKHWVDKGFTYLLAAPILDTSGPSPPGGTHGEAALVGSIEVVSKDPLSAADAERIQKAASRLAPALRNVAVWSRPAILSSALSDLYQFEDLAQLGDWVEETVKQQWPSSVGACLLQRSQSGAFMPATSSTHWCPEFSGADLGPFLDEPRRLRAEELPSSSLVAAFEEHFKRRPDNLMTVPIAYDDGDGRRTIGLVALANRQRRGRDTMANWFTPLEQYALEELVAVVQTTARRLFEITSTSEFLAHCLHESKGPVGTARTWALEVEQGRLAWNGPSRPLRQVIDNCDRALRFVELFQRGFRANSSKLEDTATCDVLGLARELVRDLAPLGRLFEVELGVEAPGGRDAIIVRGGQNGLYMVLSNLLHNSIKYAGAGRSVCVAIYPPVNGQVKVSVQDDGRGIPQSELENLERPFVQGFLPRAVVEGLAGMGLGLSIVKERLAALGSELRLETGPRGTEFSFGLDLAVNTDKDNEAPPNA